MASFEGGCVVAFGVEFADAPVVAFVVGRYSRYYFEVIAVVVLGCNRGKNLAYSLVGIGATVGF